MEKICPLYGAIAGDMIGSVYEWHNIKTKEFPLFAKKSTYTDDTVMTIATAEKLLYNSDYITVYQAWGMRYPNAGYGGRFRRWLVADEPRPYNSWGNGSAMRVSPVGWFSEDGNSVLEEAARSAEVTHNHPEGVKGAQSAALAIFLARHGASKAEIKQAIESRFGYDLTAQTLDDIRPEYKFDVSCPGTMPVAFLAFLESADYEDAIRNAVSVGGDSDTVAAITGGIALAFYRTMAASTVAEVEKRLPSDMRTICKEFTEKFAK